MGRTLGSCVAIVSIIYCASGMSADQTVAFPGAASISVAREGGEPYRWSAENLRKAHEALQRDPNADVSALAPTMITGTHGITLGHVAGDTSDIAYHEGNAELYFVVAGSGTLLVGGTLQGSRKVEGLLGELTGSAIDGAQRMALKPGDVVDIPPGTPHAVRADAAGGITFLIAKINVGLYPWTSIGGLTQERMTSIPTAPDQGKPVYWSADDFKKAHRMLIAEPNHGVSRPDITAFVPHIITRTHLMNINHRTSTDREVAVHNGNAELYFVLGGAATVTLGGTIKVHPDGHREQMGGDPIRVQPGDFLNIPPNTVHGQIPYGDDGLLYMIIKVNLGLYPWSMIGGGI